MPWLVLGLHHSAGAEPLGRVWQGLQTELGLPPPALAVDGHALLQLWLPLAEPVPAATAAAWLAAVCRRWLADVPAHRIHTWPATPARSAGASGQAGVADAPARPPQRLGDERWSAFVSPDLVPVFADAPWLDLPPGDDAQAALLARVVTATPAAWSAACALLALADPPPAAPASVLAHSTGTQQVVADPAEHSGASADQHVLAARRFLRQVMDDPQQPLGHRIEAARALLAGSAHPG